MSKPLNYGELNSLCDLDCMVGEPNNNWVGSVPTVNGIECLPILDAEMELVCFVPREKAALMVRLLNTYTHSPEE